MNGVMSVLKRREFEDALFSLQHDQIDKEALLRDWHALEQLTKCDGWEVLMRNVQLTLDACHQVLETTLDPEALRVAQGSAQAIRDLLTLGARCPAEIERLESDLEKVEIERRSLIEDG